MGENIEFKRPDGKSAPGYYAAPQNNPESAPGMVIVEEWWGVTPDVMLTADRFAGLGYRALVPDLFRGRKASVPDEADHLMQELDFQDAFSQDVRGALSHLKQKSEKAGVIGYCMGGAVAILAAMHLKEPDSAITYYGVPSADAGDPATIKVPVLCHFAEHDEFFKPDAARAFAKRLEEGKVPHEVYWYNAKHGFTNPNPLGQAGLGHYDPQAATLAWERTVQFLQRVLPVKT